MEIEFKVTDYDIVLASYQILSASITDFKYKWNWSKFYKYLNHEDDKVKWIALKCISIILGMAESVRLSYARKLIGDIKPFLTEHEESYLEPFALENPSNNMDKMNDLFQSLPYVKLAGNVLLPVFNSNKVESDYDAFVLTDTVNQNLQNLAVALSSRKCICLQGLVGCGKTTLVEYLARITGHDSSNFFKVQLSEQTDSKMLLGMYKCTDIPGEFVWQPGILTQAVIAGKWLLLEDIDNAALDVASVLNNLLETGTLSVPGYRDNIYAKNGFQLFVTQRLMPSTTGFKKQISGASNLLQKHWFCIDIQSFTISELLNLIPSLFPALETVSSILVNTYLNFSMDSHTNTISNVRFNTGRLISTRDLMKWCSRAIIDFNVSSPDSTLKIFQDAIDIYCCCISNAEQRLDAIKLIASMLKIVLDKAEYYFYKHTPHINLNSDSFIVGRAKLLRKKSEYARMAEIKNNFSFTRPTVCLLERIACCVVQKEPVLLVGETGTGKTTAIQYLAQCTGHKLIVINMNQQSESADLLGGYKPVELKFLISPIREEFLILFQSYFALEPNQKFLKHIASCYKQEQWKTLVILMRHSTNAALKKLQKQEYTLTGKNETKRKKKHDGDEMNENYTENNDLRKRWEQLGEKLEKLELQVKAQYSLVFSFVEGSLIKALREGYWVLLDEINLANAETLECLSGLLEKSSGSLSLLERGDNESVERHPDFTIFACMNPATDVGKKDLPVGLRNRFTEFYVDELTERSDLQKLVHSYLKGMTLSVDEKEKIVKFYLKIRKAAANTLLDGTGHKPHYSLRTLCRALSIAASNPCGNIKRSLYEAFCLSFLTQLNYDSYPIVQKMIVSAILGEKNFKAVIGCPISKPKCGDDEDYICFEGYWVVKGTLVPHRPTNYILTETVRRNLKDLVRVVSIGKIPVLLQGDTSVGKTSLITYLAKASGHICVRINNHEHTDLQEYIGSYVADETGKLVFREGILVEAMRKGHWIILDELNLAPSDVLEALNRVLDDNRELFIPTTQQVIKAHDNFMLFATQNPPGLYGGRKVLSRAFRNRFVELHFDEIPPNELQIILRERCQMPESYCKQVINVMTDLQIRRKSTAAFAGKRGFITLRDLFRWGERYRLAPNISTELYDWSQHLADEGYLVLTAKVRKTEEADEIIKAIKKHLKRDVHPDTLFSLNNKTSSVTKHILEELLNTNNERFNHIVWTYHMRRMAVLVKKSCQFKEPVLLVGETGCGKTTVCQLIAALNGQTLRSINCHMHTESSDFLGNLRPVREHNNSDNSKLFEWVDGPLIIAMQKGDFFLADEISLADDSVLERLNSLLEPERSLLLAEKGLKLTDEDDDSIIVADDKFVFIGTMNPGGDYGKKELSPALRNRFTEIWCEPCVELNDLNDIIIHNLDDKLLSYKQSIAKAILHFIKWLPTTDVGKRLVVSIRDILTWVHFINTCTCSENTKLNISDAYYHGACLTYIDSLGSGLTSLERSPNLIDFKAAALNYIKHQIKNTLHSELSEEFDNSTSVSSNDETNMFGISPFYITRGSQTIHEDVQFTFLPNTTKSNALKLLRALQLNKPILLEGSPGVGKTSIVSALAKASGHALLRINLSDQTDISDLFGADLPVEGGQGGEFSWRDGPFLRALKAGDWIVLDELNLASQSVLEGLNACFDHRGEIYIPELGKTFSIKSGTRLFGCQNPLKQGGARRGLPKSFLNRFSQVFIDSLTESDLMLILNVQFPELSTELIHKMVTFNSRLTSEIGVNWGFIGSPWELNLRDISRWCELTVKISKDCLNKQQMYYNPGKTMELIYVSRMRTQIDKEKVRKTYEEHFSIEKYPLPPLEPSVYISEDTFYIDDVTIPLSPTTIYSNSNLLVLRDQWTTLKQLIQCVQMNWMSILVGSSGCGKSSVVRLLANLIGQKLKCIVVNSAMDTTEILGSFEQIDYSRHLEELLERTEDLLVESLKNKIHNGDLEQLDSYHALLENVKHISDDEGDNVRTMASETKLFLQKINKLSKLVLKIKTFEPSYEFILEEIETKLKALSTSVEQDKCLNAGGKFEWVDSVLVKCLRDGTWLLIDQVNQCSPAVLDRLNGLLEPNGVLTIGERGVDNQGNVVTIKPHKNFRLFLTMDPHYGEISRAMRNRGVEIYMLGSKEKFHYNDRDLISMLYHSGITNRYNQKALHGLFKLIVTTNFFADPCDIHDLMHSAFLSARRFTRGFDPISAIKTVCQDVYIKNKSLQFSVTQEQIFDSIDNFIDILMKQNTKNNYIDVDALTWSIKNLQENFKLTIIRQEGEFLRSAINIYVNYPLESNLKKVTWSYWNDILDLEFMDEILQNLTGIKLDKILPHLLINFYERSTLADVEIRSLWYEKLPDKDDILKDLAKKSKLLASEVLSFDFHIPNRFLPWDLGYLPAFAANYANNEVMNDANKLSLLLYLRTMIIIDYTILDENLLIKKNKKISIKEYSNAIFHNKLASKFKNQPLIVNYVKLVYQINECICSLLRDKALLINNEMYIEIREGLQYLNRFVELGNEIIIDKSNSNNINLNKIVLLLKVHYKWLIKFIFKMYGICQNHSMLSQDTINNKDILLTMVSEINDLLCEIKYDPFRKITKLIKKRLILPLPYNSEDLMKNHEQMREILRNFLPCNNSTNNEQLKKQLKIWFIRADEAISIRKKMILLWTQMYLKLELYESIPREIMSMKSVCYSDFFNFHTDKELTMALQNVNAIDQQESNAIALNIQMWPIYEYLFLLLANISYKKICENTINNEIDFEINFEIDEYNWLKYFAEVPSIPTNLVAIISMIHTKKINSYERITLIFELCVFLFQFSQNSYAVKDSKMLLHLNGISEDDIENSVISYEVSETPKYTSGAVLMNLIFELILQKTEQHKEDTILAATTLSTYTIRTKQLQNLTHILWYNSVTLTSMNYEIATNDFAVMKFYLNLYVSAIDDMYAENDIDKLIISTIEKKGKHKRQEIENMYSNEYLKPIEELREIKKKFTNENTDNDIVERGRTWMLIGYFELLIFGNLGYIDPVHKISLKLKYLEEEILDIYATVYVNVLQSSIVKREFNYENASPRHSVMMKYLTKILIEKDKLKLSEAFRPASADFTMLNNDVVNFRNMITTYELVYKHINRLTFVINKINEKPSKEFIKIAEDALREAQMWYQSVKRFAEQIETKYYSVYSDIVLPILVALVHLKQGVSLLINEAEKLISSVKIDSNEGNLETLIYNMIRYPTIGTGQDNLLHLISTCTSSYTKLMINKSLLPLVDTSVSVKEQFRIVKCGLYELFNYIVLNRNLSKKNWELLNELLQQLVLIWKQQQEESEKKAAEQESLYKNKSTEANDLIVELQNMFPTYRENDFIGIENDTNANLEQNVAPTELKESYSNIISQDDIKEIQQIHSIIVTSFIKCEWIYSENDNVEPNYIRPLLERYETADMLLKSIKFNLNENLTSKLYNSLQMLVSQSLQATEDESTQQTMHSMIKTHQKPYDFYKDSNIQQVKQCLPLCNSILFRINNFLKMWPDHPVLQMIKTIIERIYSFPVTSSVGRFLIGLELLLAKLNKWEELASADYSLMNEILLLQRQIIDWRKLELACWNSCLDTTFNNMRSQTSKWWFYLYALIESYMFKSTSTITANVVKENESISKEKLIELLERFINESSLAEFETRLILLLTFHCHVLYFNPSVEREDLLAILWNIYHYYKQFIADVNIKIQSLKAPIEKKVKDFVKIVRWNDITYWSIKETVDKTHRTLHKFVKEYENSLKQSVLSYLTVTAKNSNADLGNNLKADHAQKEYVINPNDFVLPETTIKDISTQDMTYKFESKNISSRNMKYEFVSSGDKLLNKAKRYCKEIILTSSYPTIRMDVENFIQDYIEQSIHLKNLEIDKSLPKNKQKSQAKSILQQKKMTLTDYFKALNLMGVSYRIGILTWRNNLNKIIDFTIPPLDISVVNKYFNLSNVDKQMLIQWTSCDKYYYKSIIKLNALNAILGTAQTDLGVQNIERCHGYSSHMMLMANKQRLILSKLFNNFKPLRTLVENLSEIDNVYIDISQEFQSNIEIIKELMINLELSFEQLLLYLQYCPTNLSEENKMDILILEKTKLPVFNSSNNIQDDIKTRLKENLKMIRKISKTFNTVFVSTKIENMINDKTLDLYHLQVLEDTFKYITTLKLETTVLSLAFISENDKHPIVESIEFLQKQIESSIDTFNELRKLPINKNIDLSSNDTECIKRCIDNLVKNILLVIQKKYKANTIENDAPILNNDDDDDNDKNVDDEFEKNKLTEKLIEDLEKNIEELNISHISALFNDLLLKIGGNQDHKRLLLQCLPLMEQYLLLVQFYLNEQVASFRVTCKLLYLQLNVFLDLATNGFCVPKDLDLEEGDTDETGNDVKTGGMGLGEGEGQKDVSDRIETEDQLEDAKRPDEEEEKSEDKDCKEEDNGIEMSENFDNKLQDIEKDENDEEEKDDEKDEDLDKEMGETEEGAEKLDKEIWGDDEEEETENENNEPKDGEDERGQGEEIGNKELTAKDGSNKDDQNNEKEHDEDEQREEEKKEINEINEPEYNDDQIDPYYGKNQPQPEPEPLDLPEDMNLDDDNNEKEDNNPGDENPFDIDAMKDSKPPPEIENTDPTEETTEETNEMDVASDDDDDNDSNNDENKEQGEPENQDNDEKVDEDADPKGTSNQTQDINKEEKEEEKKDEEAEDKQELQEKAAPSADDASKELDAAEQIDASKDGSKDNVIQESQTEQKQETPTESSQDDSKNNGVGQSHSERQESGHAGSSLDENSSISHQESKSQQMNKRKTLDTADENRSLFDTNQPEMKKLKMIHTQEEISEQEQQDQSTNKDKDDIDMCQHIKNSEQFDDYAMDAATDNQVKQQASNIEDEEKKEEEKEESMDIDLHQDESEDNKEENNVPKQNPETLARDKKEQNKDDSSVKGNNTTEMNQVETNVEVEGDVVQTCKIERGNDTTFHTNMDVDNNSTINNVIETARSDVEKILSEWTDVPSTEEAAIVWNRLCEVTDSAARGLSEQLRLVLEPTKATRLKGDYRTGKRINMRKIIPFIASQFRKDKIWLRRTKPFKRNYQIVLALDDSSSMADNHSKELAFESLSLISKALTYLEVGELSVISFGERVSVLHPLGETFTEQSGSRLIQNMRFEQTKTSIGQLVEFTVDMFETQSTSSDNAKLVVILSDGRGVFSEGIDKINYAVRRAKMADIFLVFIIVDNPINKDSILDIRMPVFEDGKLLGIRSYMDSFPFPFYMILRDINMLPEVLSDALRQWFEVVGKIDA
ncbi:midasin [Polistes fuscatus]|uniref:midasin n=3 Tax=Polistes fuscatus TaxID=30207 RepID=UPI001CA936B1|nr:midasin [Polistes fuscatus]